MSGDREARAVGAGDSVTVSGTKYELRPVGVRALCGLEREALKAYKREVLETYRENADMLPEGALEKKVLEVSTWDVSSLPQKPVFSAKHIPVTDALLNWVESQYGKLEAWENDEEGRDRVARMMVEDGLDSGAITAEKVKELSKAYPRQGRVRWDQWWVTGCMSGRLSFIHQAVKKDHPELTQDDIGDWPAQKIAEAARIIEGLSAASVGNTSG